MNLPIQPVLDVVVTFCHNNNKRGQNDYKKKEIISFRNVN